MTFSKSRLLYLFALLATFMLSSCGNKEFVTNSKIGKVDLSIRSEITFKSEGDLSSFSDYLFSYEGVDGYRSSEPCKVGSVSWPMDWYFGIFRLHVQSCTPEDAEKDFGCIRFEGISETFSVINDQIATASVECAISNCMVRVNFDNTMYDSFYDYKLVVESYTAPEPDPETDERAESVILRSLDFTARNKVGYYNLHATENINLKYQLYIKAAKDSDFIQSISGYFCEDDGETPAVVRSGDAVTLNIRYAGKPTENIKFVISGEKDFIVNTIGLEDYTQGSVVEDR